MTQAFRRLLLVCLLLLSWDGCAHNGGMRIEELKTNVVRVRTTFPQAEICYGFGFITGERWNDKNRYIHVLTANHNLRPEGLDYPDFQIEKVEVMFYPCEGHGWIEAVHMHPFDEEMDIVLLQVDIRHCSSVSRFNRNADQSLAWKIGQFARPKKHEQVWFIGRDGEWQVPLNGTIESMNRVNHQIVVNISSVKPGSSGAPLINRHGKIIGLLTMDKGSSSAKATSMDIIQYTIREKWRQPFDEIIAEGSVSQKVNCDPEKGRLADNQIRNDFGMRFVPIDSGNTSNEHYIQKTEVTQCQWEAVMADRPSYFNRCGDHCPVENVSWQQVQAFIVQLNALDNVYDYRLPTEVEWEWACGVSTQQKTMAPGFTLAVMSYPANANNIFDMNGNVREWCDGEFICPAPPTTGKMRVVRGGGWRSSAANQRCDTRDGVHETVNDPTIGLRLVAEPS
ncbi:MAG: SUMF1/EgtB/PvdO family nonheme iron enzyme [Desulfobacterales bacterium]|nr:SUMF1/EgtB/PvdO family nonheme iron enzyme [Desulfobacterales bacterium]